MNNVHQLSPSITPASAGGVRPQERNDYLLTSQDSKYICTYLFSKHHAHTHTPEQQNHTPFPPPHHLVL